MAAGLKCPLPPPSTTLPLPLPLPDPPLPCGTPSPSWTLPMDSITGGRQGGQGRLDEQGRIHDITDAARDFALQLPWALLLVFSFKMQLSFRHTRLLRFSCRHEELLARGGLYADMWDMQKASGEEAPSPVKSPPSRVRAKKQLQRVPIFQHRDNCSEIFGQEKSRLSLQRPVIGCNGHLSAHIRGQ